jgi:hypothetical protein
MNGARILSDEGYIAGTCIPVVPFYGKRWYVDGIERMQGHVRLARDAQVLDNMLKSWLAEMAARFDIEKPILTPEQIAGHAQMWADDAIQKYPYLLINPMLDAAAASRFPAGPVATPRRRTCRRDGRPRAAGRYRARRHARQPAGRRADAAEPVRQGDRADPAAPGHADLHLHRQLRKTVKRVGEVWLSMAKELLRRARAAR